MTAYLDGPMCAFDTESTGVDVENDRIVTACTVLLKPDTPLWTQEIESHLIAVEVDIPEDATAVHGITTKFARDNGRPAIEVLDMVADDLTHAMLAGIPLVGYNLAYDNTLLDRELRRHDLPTVEDRLGGPLRPVLDVHVLDKWLDPYRPGGRRLTDLCQVLGIEFVGAHDSTADALASARCAYRLGVWAHKPDEELYNRFAAARRRPAEVVARFRQLAEMTLADLHDAQIGWRRVQCDGLRTYFDAKGIAHDGVRGDWPLIPYAVTDEAPRDSNFCDPWRDEEAPF